MKTITVCAYWHDTPSLPFYATCQIGLDIGEDDDSIFYYFAEHEEIIGKHGDFTVTSIDEE